MKIFEEKLLCNSYISKKYNGIGEINTNLSYISIDADFLSSDTDFFVQGHEADEITNQIFDIWVNEELTTEEAFKAWINRNF